jgi:hypothetical protein
MTSNAAEFIEKSPALQKRFLMFCDEIVAAHRSVRFVDVAGKSYDPFFTKDCLICCFGENQSSPQIFIVAPNTLGDFIIQHRPTGSVYVRNLTAINDYQADPSGGAYSGLIAEAALTLLSGSNAINQFSPLLEEPKIRNQKSSNPKLSTTFAVILSLFGMLSVLGGLISVLLDFTDFGAWIALAIGAIIIWRTRME